MSDEPTKQESDTAPDAAAAEEEAPAVESEEAAAPEEESTATFAPVVQLAEVEVVTGEDDEDVIYSQRSKVYVYGETLLNKGTGKNEWLTRGVGDAKLLQNKETGMIRLLMRQEKTLTIRINHLMDPRIVISPHPLMEKTYMWRAHDFSDNVELVETTFALLFKDQDYADAFFAAFTAAQAHMKSLGYGLGDDNDETPSGEATTSASTAATDDLTGALAGLSTSENAAEEAKES